LRDNTYYICKLFSFLQLADDADRYLPLPQLVDKGVTVRKDLELGPIHGAKPPKNINKEENNTQFAT